MKRLILITIITLSLLSISSLNQGDDVRVTVPLPGSLASKIVK